MARKKIDLSDIKEKELEEATSFTDLMSRKERKKRVKIDEDIDELEEMLDERVKKTKDLKEDLTGIIFDNKKKKTNIEKTDKIETKKIKEEKLEEKQEEKFSKTQILDLTRQMKFNYNESIKENNENKKKGFTLLNIIGIINLICIGFYICLLIFTSYQDLRLNYIINGGIIVSLVLFFGLSIVTNKKARKVFNIFNLLAILAFIAFNIYTFIK